MMKKIKAPSYSDRVKIFLLCLKSPQVLSAILSLQKLQKIDDVSRGLNFGGPNEVHALILALKRFSNRSYFLINIIVWLADIWRHKENIKK